MWVRAPGSVTDVSDVHKLNASLPMYVSEVGRVTAVSEVHERNALSPT
jgi:hypothetical protein